MSEQLLRSIFGKILSDTAAAKLVREPEGLAGQAMLDHVLRIFAPLLADATCRPGCKLRWTLQQSTRC